MVDKDIIHERGRSLEDDYFRKKDKELVEKLQRAADFVALQVSDEVPLGRGTAYFTNLFVQLAHAVFTAFAQSDGQSCSHRIDWVPLRHGYDRDLMVPA